MSKGVIQKAVKGVASNMVISPNVRATSVALPDGGSVSGFDSGTLVSAIRDAVSGMNNQNGDIVIPVYLGGT